jgi:septal ring factor EnvC (AmiA/AmiB activator)
MLAAQAEAEARRQEQERSWERRSVVLRQQARAAAEEAARAATQRAAQAATAHQAESEALQQLVDRLRTELMEADGRAAQAAAAQERVLAERDRAIERCRDWEPPPPPPPPPQQEEVDTQVTQLRAMLQVRRSLLLCGAEPFQRLRVWYG